MSTPNAEGNRHAALTVTEDQSMNRRVRLTVVLGRNFDEFTGRAWGRDRLTVLLESLKVKLDRLVN